MPEKPNRLQSEEIWATALAVIGGLAVLVPLIVIALGSQRATPVVEPPPPPAGETPSKPPVVVSPDRPREVDRPVPSTALELQAELEKARERIDVLGEELEAIKTNADASERSARRAWVQLREAAGEAPDLDREPGGDEDPEGGTQS